MISVLITVPNMHWIHHTVVRCLLLLQQDGRYKLTFKLPSEKPYENNLHNIVVDFRTGDYNYWLNIDADNPPVNNPLDLIELDKDIIGLPTPIWHYIGKAKERPVYWNAYKYDTETDRFKEYEPKQGLQKVDAIGTGCFIVAKRVFEHPELQKGAFFRTWNENGIMKKGNDIAFCERAYFYGFEIYCHFDYPCDHFREGSLNDVVQGFRLMYEGGV